ncbi:MAG TPA: proline dehydrogenase family protein, partial [Saprospiraceae bacterium]|nr:proline dehydrogenase family protein [Saprospiraceae bacterium]
CQLYGMSDNLTFNLAAAGYNAGKYLPYGPVKDVIPYLVRRAEENSSITGDIGREYSLVLSEMKRREL